MPDLPRELPIERVRAGTRWMRIHLRGKEPLWFGPATGSPPVNRFDDPNGEFGVCYLGTMIEACFAETFLRNPPVRVLTMSDLASRCIATLEVRREVRLVSLHGAGLARIGLTAEIAAERSYERSQALSRTIWKHRDLPDGIAYRSRHDNSAFCIALFDRAGAHVENVGSASLVDDPRLLGRILNRYALGLTR